MVEGIDLKKEENSAVFANLQYLNVCTNKIQAVNIGERTYPYLKYLVIF